MKNFWVFESPGLVQPKDQVGASSSASDLDGPFIWPGCWPDQSRTAPGVIGQLLSSLPERERETRANDGQCEYEYLAKTRLISWNRNLETTRKGAQIAVIMMSRASFSRFFLVSFVFRFGVVAVSWFEVRGSGIGVLGPRPLQRNAKTNCLWVSQARGRA